MWSLRIGYTINCLKQPNPAMTDDTHPPASADGAASPDEPALTPDEEPVFTGTLFLTLLLLMMIFGFWAMMYLVLLDR